MCVAVSSSCVLKVVVGVNREFNTRNVYHRFDYRLKYGVCVCVC